MSRVVFFLFLMISLITIKASSETEISIEESTKENNDAIKTTNSVSDKANKNSEEKIQKIEVKAPERSLFDTIDTYLRENMGYNDASLMKKTFLMDIILIVLSHGGNEQQTELLKEFTLAATKDFPDEMHLNELSDHLEEEKMLNLLSEIYLKDRMKRDAAKAEREGRAAYKREVENRKAKKNNDTNSDKPDKGFKNQINVDDKKDKSDL